MGIHLKSYREKSMEEKILFNTMMITLIPIVLVAILAYVSYLRITVDEQKRNLDERLNMCAQLVNSHFDMYIQKSHSIMQNRYLLQSLQIDYQEDLEKMMVFFKNLDMLIEEPFGTEYNGYFRIYPFNQSLYTGNYTDDYDKIKENEWIKGIVKDNSNKVYWSPEIYINPYKSNKRYIRFYRIIKSFDRPLGLLEANIPYENIQPLLDTAGLPEKGLIFTTTKTGELIYFKGDRPEPVPDNDKLHDSGKYIEVSRELSNGNVIYSAIPWSEIYGKSVLVLIGLILGMAAIGYTIYIVSRLSAKRATRQLSNFIKVISENESILLNQELIDVSGEYEVSVVKTRFKDMIARINELYSEAQLMQQQKNSFERELLQARINPHLLYNSLGVVKWKAQWNHDKDMVELIEALTGYYRAALNKGNDILKFGEELNMILDFVKINEFNNSSKYNLTIDCDERVRNCYTIKHLQQPVVENAILHGLNGMEAGGSITIEAKIQDHTIVVRISDNGIGMDPQKVSQILSRNYNGSVGGYGMKNLISRIEMYYGESCGLDIQSEPGKGTVVAIKVLILDEEGAAVS